MDNVVLGIRGFSGSPGDHPHAKEDKAGYDHAETFTRIFGEHFFPFFVPLNGCVRPVLTQIILLRYAILLSKALRAAVWVAWVATRVGKMPRYDLDDRHRAKGLRGSEPLCGP